MRAVLTQITHGYNKKGLLSPFDLIMSKSDTSLNLFSWKELLHNVHRNMKVCGQINTDSMRTQRKTPAVAFAGTGYTRSVDCRMLTNHQERPTGKFTQKVQGNTPRNKWERMRCMVREKVQECTQACIQAECRHAHMFSRWFTLSPPAPAHSHRVIQLLCHQFLVHLLFDKHAAQTMWDGSRNSCLE